MKRILIVGSLLSFVTLATAGHPNPEKLADAIWKAEGGKKARSPYGVLSVKVRDEAHARRITLNSINNNWTRWEQAGKPEPFIKFMARRWTPESADPQGHINWVKNVTCIYNAK